MKNPFANFDLEESLSGLPEGLRQPMVLAVVASGLVHGFTFLLLPVLTTSAEAKQQGTERVVSVVELTPEEQAKLPLTMTAVNPLVNGLPPGALGKVPLTGLFPSTTTPGIKLTPSPNPVNDFFNNVNKSSSSGSTGLGLGSYSLSDPIITSNNPPSGLSASERKRLQEIEEDYLKRKDEEAKKAKEEEEKKKEAGNNPANDTKNDPQKNQPQVEPNQQPSTPTPPGTVAGTPSSPTTPPSPTVPQATPELIAATTYGLPEGGDKPEYVQQQSQQLQIKILESNIPPELAQLPDTAQKKLDWIGSQTAAFSTLQTQEVPPQAAALPPGVSEFKFGSVPPQAQVTAVIEVYAAPDGKLLAEPTVIRSSGFKHLDDTALNQIKDAMKKNPLKNPVRYVMPFQISAVKPSA